MQNKYAIAFPGQGKQDIGMLKELAGESSLVQETFDEATAVLGYDLWDLVQHGPVDKIQQTEFTQPIMLAAGVAVWRVWRMHCDVLPDVMAGHSLGEYTALVCANVLDFKDAIRVVQARGKFMQEACPYGGGMAALVGLTDELLQKTCHEAAEGEVIEVANYNSPGQVVVSGNLTALERAVVLAKDFGAKVAKILPMSVPAHSTLMRPAVERLRRVLEEVVIKAPLVPVIHNVDINCYYAPEQIREVLIKQLCGQVRWVETVQSMVKRGVTCILECGPGKVLTGLNKRISSEITTDYLGEMQKILAYAGGVCVNRE